MQMRRRIGQALRQCQLRAWQGQGVPARNVEEACFTLISDDDAQCHDYCSVFTAKLTCHHRCKTGDLARDLRQQIVDGKQPDQLSICIHNRRAPDTP